VIPGRPLSKIAIKLAAMGDSQCENHEFRVLDRVDNPVVTTPIRQRSGYPTRGLAPLGRGPTLKASMALTMRRAAGLSSLVSSLRALGSYWTV
jgi:hypothetical protein